MSFKLLHYLNSAFFGLPQKIESIQHAIACLGLIEIKRWVNILTLSSMSDKPSSVLQNVLIRAKMCELIARELKDDQEHYFLIGMLSGLDSLLDMPVTKVMEQLPLAEDIDDAVLNYRGNAGEALQFCIAYERWEPGLTTFRKINPERIANIYLESIDWWATRILPFLAA